ncbi:hypothetical protein WH47_08705 [Habropoda laboriosa]|uniref:Uncharacterized protein n=1 Tax=Habropoda laboriosa TaxID=597456 RepID=A0A0L7QNX9_9HYME|nr:hypothetical protein WH47_08705 [Habropoda laboriosa]
MGNPRNFSTGLALGAVTLTSLWHHSLHRFSCAHHKFRGRAVTFCLLPMLFSVTHGKRRSGATNGPRVEPRKEGNREGREGKRAQRERGQRKGLEAGR